MRGCWRTTRQAGVVCCFGGEGGSAGLLDMVGLLLVRRFYGRREAPLGHYGTGRKVWRNVFRPAAALWFLDAVGPIGAGCLLDTLPRPRDRCPAHVNTRPTHDW